jgi:protein-tyrosine phosphatase
VQSLGVRTYADDVRKCRLEYLVLPIIDMCVPEDGAVAHAFIGSLAAKVRDGRRVLVHCRCSFNWSQTFAHSG